MEQIKYFSDTHISKAVATQLRRRGVDIERSEDVGLSQAPDTELLVYATAQGRVMISHDDDFLKLHRKWQARGQNHAGIMYVLPHLQGSRGIGKIVQTLLDYHEMIEIEAGTLAEDIANRVIFIS